MTVSVAFEIQFHTSYYGFNGSMQFRVTNIWNRSSD